MHTFLLGAPVSRSYKPIPFQEKNWLPHVVRLSCTWSSIEKNEISCRVPKIFIFSYLYLRYKFRSSTVTDKQSYLPNIRAFLCLCLSFLARNKCSRVKGYGIIYTNDVIKKLILNIKNVRKCTLHKFATFSAVLLPYCIYC